MSYVKVPLAALRAALVDVTILGTPYHHCIVSPQGLFIVTRCTMMHMPFVVAETPPVEAIIDADTLRVVLPDPSLSTEAGLVTLSFAGQLLSVSFDNSKPFNISQSAQQKHHIDFLKPQLTSGVFQPTTDTSSVVDVRVLSLLTAAVERMQAAYVAYRKATRPAPDAGADDAEDYAVSLAAAKETVDMPMILRLTGASGVSAATCAIPVAVPDTYIGLARAREQYRAMQAKAGAPQYYGFSGEAPVAGEAAAAPARRVLKRPDATSPASVPTTPVVGSTPGRRILKRPASTA